jgi:hypothetical protein
MRATFALCRAAKALALLVGGTPSTRGVAGSVCRAERPQQRAPRRRVLAMDARKCIGAFLSTSAAGAPRLTMRGQVRERPV